MPEYVPGYSFQIVSGPYFWPVRTRIELVETLLDMGVKDTAGGLWIRYKILGIPVCWPCRVTCDGVPVSNFSLRQWCGLEDVNGS